MTVVATAGHVDHGKSSLVRALTGTDPDRFVEERQRGLTIDLGFAHTTLDSGRVLSFVDVPGHVRFVRNMLAGVGSAGSLTADGVAVCLFVVAATEGWKPQSEEHLRILGILGVRRAVVALTKVDLVDADVCELAVLETREHLTGTPLAGAPVVPVSSVTGAGLAELRTALDAALAEVEAGSAGATAARRRPRLWVDRVFTARGSGTVVTGTLTGAGLRVDEQVIVLPDGRRARVRAIQTLGRVVDAVDPGNRVALNLAGVDHHDLRRGDAVVLEGEWAPTAMVDASLEVLASLDHPVSRRGAYLMYVGSREIPVRVRILGPEALGPGQAGAVRLYLTVSLPLTPGDRYVLRETGRDETVGGGEILDIDPVMAASRAAPDRSVARVVRERGWVRLGHLEQLVGPESMPEPDAPDALHEVVLAGGWAVHEPAYRAAVADLLERVDAAGALGLEMAALDERQRVAVESLVDGGELRSAGGRVRRAHVDDPLANHPVLEQLRAAGPAPPDPAQLGAQRAELRELVRRGAIVESGGLMFHPDALAAATAATARLLEAHPDGFTVAQLRDALGITRKHAIPLVAALDARAVTRRRGDLRVGGPGLRPSADS